MAKQYKKAAVFNTPAIFITFIAVLFCSCKDGLYVSFLIPEKTREFTEVRSGVEVRLRLSTESLLQDKLYIINKSKDTVYINPREFFYSVKGRDIKIPLEEDYDTYIMKMNSKINTACEGANFPYKCVELITNLNNGFKGQGFPFFAIEPKKERKGYIAFNFPTPLNDSPSKDALMPEWARNYKTLRGGINLELIIGNKVEAFVFPVDIQLYDNLKQGPSELQPMLQ